MALTITLIGVMTALAAQAAFVLFLLNNGPLGIDTGNTTSMPTAFATNISLLVAFGAIHSLMARPGFKQWWKQLVPQKAERGVYILMSGITLGAIIHLWVPLPHELWAFSSAWLRAAFFASFGVGLIIVFWSIFSIDFLHFHGLRQATTSQPKEPPFTVRGPYRFVRHPIQSGLIIAMWSTPDMSLGHALFAAGMTFYSLLATLALEEPDLRKALGDRYRDYSIQVPAIVPRLFGFRER